MPGKKLISQEKSWYPRKKVVSIRNKLSNDPDFKNKIELKIKKYGDAASEYKTRGADKPNINSEFSDVMKNMRKGLQNYNQP